MAPVAEQLESVTPQAGGWVCAALSLSCGNSASVAAREAGVCLRTIRRWQGRPAFKQLVEQLRSEMLSATLGKLIDKNAAAVETLGELLSNEQGSVRLGAASRLLELTLKVREQFSLVREYQELRAILARLKRDHPEMLPQMFMDHHNGQ